MEFCPVDLNVPGDVAIKSVHLSDALLELSYYMVNATGAKDL